MWTIVTKVLVLAWYIPGACAGEETNYCTHKGVARNMCRHISVQRLSRTYATANIIVTNYNVHSPPLRFFNPNTVTNISFELFLLFLI